MYGCLTHDTLENALFLILSFRIYNEIYRELNQDLKLSRLRSKNDFTNHFINNGKKEGRLFNEKLKEFDKNTYLEENKETDKYLIIK